MSNCSNYGLNPFGKSNYMTIYDDFCGAKMKIDPKEYPFSVLCKDFKTRADAENYAKKRSGETNDDVVILQRVAVVKFPIPDLKVEELVVS